MSELPRTPLRLPVDPAPTVPPVAARRVLSRLGALVRTYVVVEGAALVLAVLGATFWLSFGLDRWLELSRLIRFCVLLATGLACFGLVSVFVLMRLMRDFNLRSLALVLERKFPGLDDGLITTIEMSGRTNQSPLTASMLERTASQVTQLLPQLKLSSVFNLRPLLRTLMIAGMFLLTIGAWTAYARGDVELWYRRNVLLKEDLWPRETDLKIYVLADPEERMMEFRDGIYKHPQGANLTLIAEVPEGRRVPSQVWFNYSPESGRADRPTMAKLGDRKFQFTLPGVHSSARLWFYGGDYSSRTPLTVQVVRPPRVDGLSLDCLYPEYTNKNSRDDKNALIRESIPVQSSDVAVPAGTDFILRAKSNKPLQGFRLQTDLWTLEASAAGVKFRSPPEADPVDLASAKPLVSADGRELAVPCILTTRPAAMREKTAPAVWPLHLPPTVAMAILLHDTDDIITAEPSRFNLNSIPDAPPSVVAELKGIGNSITRQARIPVQGMIVDDYGVVGPRFEYKLESESHFETRPFAGDVQQRKEMAFSEKFEILPLDLMIGQKLVLAVSAADAADGLPVINTDPLSIVGLSLPMFAPDPNELLGPHRSQGERYTFEIVTNEELLAQIAARELNLRQRFEQIISEVKNTRRDLQLEFTRFEKARTAPAPSGTGDGTPQVPLNQSFEEFLAIAERSVSQVAKNRNETQSVEEAFRDIRNELENNAVPDVKALLQRVDDGIVKPLNSVNTKDYQSVDDALTALKQGLEARQPATQQLDETIDNLNTTITHLESVLAQMLKLESYNEAIQLLREIIMQQEELRDKTKAEKKRQAIEGLQD